ncbi:hypothetical protein [Sandaracinus amylolyticus]|uniref:hypothetical protein n=1 Tax=Sandaracinus amylolyticus TaxID=927083 RepID=UPI001F30CBD3|nr:hypothetical protein [Sandaracinus amylolyticus]
MYLRLAGLLAAWVALAGCHEPTTFDLDAGPADASPPGATGLIEIEGAPTLALAPGAHAEFVARWTDAEGRPVAMRDVSFALDGMARDSTLFSLGGRTDEDGRVTGMVIAGSETATFRLRVAAPGAQAAYLEVAVSADGFGRLVVAVEGGDGRDIAQRTVLVHQSTSATDRVSCDDALTRREADRSRTIDALGEAVFAPLPAAQRFTIVARATSSASLIVAEGCVEDVMLEPLGDTRATVTLVPRTLGIEGEYDAELALRAGMAPSLAADALALALEGTVVASGGDASMMLDALESTLRDRGATAALSALEAARATGSAERELATRLALDGASLAGGARVVLEEIVALHRGLVVDGVLFVAGSMDGPVASFTRGEVRLGEADADLVMIDLREVGVAARAAAAVRWNEGSDVLQLESMRIELPVATLLVSGIEALARARGLESAGALIASHGGCDVLQAWIAEQDDLATACGADCATAACDAVGGAVMALARGATAPLDALSARVVLAGPLSTEDADGNLSVDALRAETLSGSWRSADGLSGEAVDATFGGARISPLP